jgi:RNA polymerase sigma factor (sigma-70 family)
VLTAIALLFQMRANRNQRVEAAALRGEIHDLREIVLRQARDVPPDEVAESITRHAADLSVSEDSASVGLSADDLAEALAWEPVRDPAAVGELIERLPDREKLVLSLYYYDHLTMREIGEVLGVTDIRVSQLLAQAIKRLRDAGA